MSLKLEFEEIYQVRVWNVLSSFERKVTPFPLFFSGSEWTECSRRKVTKENNKWKCGFEGKILKVKIKSLFSLSNVFLSSTSDSRTLAFQKQDMERLLPLVAVEQVFFKKRIKRARKILKQRERETDGKNSNGFREDRVNDRCSMLGPINCQLIQAKCCEF